MRGNIQTSVLYKNEARTLLLMLYERFSHEFNKLVRRNTKETVRVGISQGLFRRLA